MGTIAGAVDGGGTPSRILPFWLPGYGRVCLASDFGAGLIDWFVVVPQAVAYAQIAGLSPEAGLVAAPGALIGYPLLGMSRTLVVSATTATVAVSASAVGSIAGGDATRFATLSAAPSRSSPPRSSSPAACSDWDGSPILSPSR